MYQTCLPTLTLKIVAGLNHHKNKAGVPPTNKLISMLNSSLQELSFLFCMRRQRSLATRIQAVVFGDTVGVVRAPTHTALYTSHRMRGYDGRILNY